MVLVELHLQHGLVKMVLMARQVLPVILAPQVLGQRMAQQEGLRQLRGQARMQ